jgi:rubrerythrin
MADTKANLKEAFAGESQANRSYLFFAEKAEQEGKPEAARLFRAVAEAETVHARNHFRVLGIGATEENLQKAIAGEYHEYTGMYPAFIQQARVEGNKQAEVSFDWANRVEQLHHGLYEKAANALKSGQKSAVKAYYVCQTCGNTVENEAPDKCPICGAPKIKFKRVE